MQNSQAWKFFFEATVLVCVELCHFEVAEIMTTIYLPF